MRLSVLDQSPVSEGTSPQKALAHTVELAQLAERLGYERYWLAEHHGTSGLAGSAPAVLIAHVAAQTEAIRVGSGGVMLSHYSPLRVAEEFRLLESLHPGRIDLGVGRAPGSEPITAFALQRNRLHPVGDDFVDQLIELRCWLEGSFPEGHPFGRLQATPVPESAPAMWLLSSSGYSATLAAQLGAGFCFAHFISDAGGPEAIAAYREAFVATRSADGAQAAVGLGVICAETAEEASELASSAALWRLRRRKGLDGPVPSPAEARAYVWSESDYLRAGAQARRTVVGTPAQVREQLEALAERYGVDELVVVTITHDHGARLRSYELLADAFGLTRRG